MPRSRDSWVFVLLLLSAAAVLFSIAGAETLLAMAAVAWIVHRPKRIVWPGYFVPLAAFMASTALALYMSPQPEIGWSVVRKFVLFTMGFLTANLVTSPARAQLSAKVLLGISAVASAYALIQFGIGYLRFLSTNAVADDPTAFARITGFMSHWMTFSGEQLLIWCAAIPAMLVLGRRWMLPLGIVGAALIFSFTRSVWLGAIAGFGAAALLMPRRVVIGIAVPAALVGAAASGLIYHRISMSFQQQRFSSDSARVELFIGGVRMIQDHPWFGVGPERIQIEFPRYYRGKDLLHEVPYYGHLENNIVQIAAERGLICLGTFLWLIFQLYADFIAMLKTASAESRWIALSAISALTGFLVSGFFSYNFGDSEVLLLLLFLISVPYGVRGTVQVGNQCLTNVVPIPS